MGKRLSDEDIERIAVAVASKTQPKPLTVHHHIITPAADAARVYGHVRATVLRGLVSAG